MPVFIYEPDAFDKLCRVEGERYPENQRNFGPCSFGAFKEHWEQAIKRDPSLKELGKDATIRMSDGNSTIYGYHGWNRYLVYYSGEIVFLELWAGTQEDVQRAKEVGFRIE